MLVAFESGTECRAMQLVPQPLAHAGTAGDLACLFSPASYHLPLLARQVEVHPYHRNDALLAFCAQHSIHVTAYAPLGSPDSASIFPRKKPLVLMEDATVKVGCAWDVFQGPLHGAQLAAAAWA